MNHIKSLDAVVVQAGTAACGQIDRRFPGIAVCAMFGTRINSVGRLEDMAIDIECMLTNDHVRATRASTEASADWLDQDRTCRHTLGTQLSNRCHEHER